MRRWMQERPLTSLVVLLFSGTVVGEVLVWWAVGAMPPVAAEQGRVVDDAITFLGYLVVPVFLFVTLVLLYATTVWKVPDGDRENSAHQVRTDRRTVLTWAGSTLALAVLVTVHPGITGILELSSQARRTPDTLVVRVTASQWGWTFSYPEYGVRNSPVLVLPVDRKVRFVLRSRDVIHSFWIPSMRLKRDVIPGERRVLHLTPDTVTSTAVNPMTRVQCAELCGVGHAQMWARVRVVRAAGFDDWVASQTAEPGGMEM